MYSDFSGSFWNKSYGRFSERRFLNFVYFSGLTSNRKSEKNEKLKKFDFFLFFLLKIGKWIL
jgi:hypothetical protein